MRPGVRPLAGCLLCVLLLAGCLAEEEHVGDEPIHAFAITTQTAPLFAGEEESLYIVEARIELPITPPNNLVLDRLSQSDTEDVPWDRLPWVRGDDLAIEVDWALTNLEDSDARVAVILNGFNEFHEYQPGFVVDDDDVIPDFSQWERELDLGPFETRTGTIRIEELDEVAVDLSTVVNGAPNSNMVVHFESHSATDPRVQPFIPPTIAGLTGIRVGMRATNLPETECADGADCGLLVFEATVRVRDDADKLASGDDEPWELPDPAPFVPVVADL